MCGAICTITFANVTPMEFPARYMGHRGITSKWSKAQSDQLVSTVQIDTESSAAEGFSHYSIWFLADHGLFRS